MEQLKDFLLEIREEAQREEFPIDREVYEVNGMDPLDPIPCFGNLASPLCFFARDLGKDEVKARQPLYGSAGRLVRQGIHRALEKEQTSDLAKLQKAADKVLLSNTVPYKPPGNKAYSMGVKKRFRPFLERLLTQHWQGSYIITLGNEAFKWFTPYAPKGVVNDYFKQEDRYESELKITLTALSPSGEAYEKKVFLAPLPHPSPLNQKYYALFPDMLDQRLEKLLEKVSLG